MSRSIRITSRRRLVAALAFLTAIAPAAHAQQRLSGLWDGLIKYDSVTIAFPIEFAGSGSQISASFFNGKERVTSTSGQLVGDSVVIAFDHLATRLAGVLANGVFTARYGSISGRGLRDVEARPHQGVAATSRPAPDISGTWLIPANSSKGEKAWRFVVQQSGVHITATILRVDGDAGAHVGEWNDGKVVLNHFDGARPSQIEVALHEGGGLDVTQISTGRGRGQTILALRPDVAVARGLAEPADFTTHTGVKDPKEPFRFSFPDLTGKLVSNTDAQFVNAVVVVTIGGSWCPNCHDEAPFLTELYTKYHSRGLEIVALDFEQRDQLQDFTQLRAFIKKYGIEYTVLVPGETGELHAKVPQAENLDSWPTTFFLGRDGTVRAVHAGFAAPASGEFHTQLRAEYAGIVERLLAEGTR